MKRSFPSLFVTITLALPMVAHAKTHDDPPSCPTVDRCDHLKLRKSLSGFEKDQKLLACKGKEQKKGEKILAQIEMQLKPIQKAQDPKTLSSDYQFADYDRDCFSGCKPASLGGDCSDMIFTQHMGIAADAAEAGKVDAAAFSAYYAGRYDDTAKKNLCGAIQQTIEKSPQELAQDASNCQDAIHRCRFNARDAKVAELKITQQICRQTVEDLDDDIDDLKTRLTEGYHAPGYYQRVPAGFDQMSSTVNGLNPPNRDSKAADQGSKNTPDAMTGTSQQVVPAQAGAGEK